ncbi:AraC family transcriptional regulator [Vibrio sp. SCSIO 43140]|uniref:AraC family transcriptional regulator n=1 Tax=Vibrio sp. SCSIO 43140 TaxID=2819100 RepID=UPI002074F76C|nr:AraC family transcriptional regulator [Vibrio sp. SCSIO 43140]USD62654.1 AraC family transcriptional regulator [Vibrio sp. SCSIO 43140]
MKVDYQQKLQPVIRYLEQHFDQPLNLEVVAKKAHLSPYHFHRIFKVVTGETLNDFLRRLRLEQAANTLFYNKPGVTEVALDHGFGSSQSMAKAFKKYFGITPTQIRDCDDLDQYAQLMRSSKIGHLLRNNGHESVSTTPYTDFEPYKWSTQMEIRMIESGQLAFVRVTGPYGNNYEPAVGKLYSWAGPNGLAAQTNVFIYHDNPEITPAEKCRTDIGLLLDSSVDTPAGIEMTEFEGGKYACIRKTITEKSQYSTAWEELMAQVVEQQLETDERPCFELYHSYDIQTNVADVSFCTAIKALQ